jgi:hypothetical protein
MLEWTREDLLYVPLALSAVSLLYLLIKRIVTWKSVEATNHAFDGFRILTFTLLRLFSILALLSLECFQLATGRVSRVDQAQVLFYVTTYWFPSLFDASH